MAVDESEVACEAGRMQCPQCRGRKARRACPALGVEICSVCCGTKRLVEIRCPDHCGYLSSARIHPPAALQRRHLADLRFLAPIVAGLTDAQHRIFILLQMLVRKRAAETVPSINDEDVRDAAGALAATLEGASRGIIYQHEPASLQARRVLRDLQFFIQELSRQAPRAERDAAVALRALERAARTARAGLEDDDKAFLRLVDRILHRRPGTPDDADAMLEDPRGLPMTADPPRLIVPG